MASMTVKVCMLRAQRLSMEGEGAGGAAELHRHPCALWRHQVHRVHAWGAR